MAGFALKMAKFDTGRAIEILLSNQDELITFMEKSQIEKAKKEQAEIDKVQKLSLFENDDSVMFKPITVEDFKKYHNIFKLRLYNTLFKVTENSTLTQS